MKKACTLLWLCFLPLLFLAGCGRNEIPMEGDCILTVAVENIPPQLDVLKELIPTELIGISVSLKNISTEKVYKLVLNEANGFSVRAGLNPGVYHIESCYADYTKLLPLDAVPGSKSVELSKDQESKLNILIENEEELAKLAENLRPDSELLAMSPFSGVVRFNGQQISLKEIPGLFPFSLIDGSEPEPVEPYEKAVVYNQEEDIRVTVVNESAESAAFNQCKVISVQFGKNNVVLGGGISMGTSMSGVCHAQTGIYGTPDKMEGAPFRGTGMDSTSLIYQDPESGDRLTLRYSPWEDVMTSILYEFAQYD